MAAGDSIVSICNVGLIAIGEPPITSLGDNRKAAIYCTARYDQVRREVLRSGTWNFAKRQAALPASPTSPLFDWTNSFPLPADYIRLLRMQRDPQSAYEEAADASGALCLWSNDAAPLNILYVYDIQDPTKFDPIFVAALGYAMGAELAMPITQSKAKRDDCVAQSTAKIGLARFTGSQESSPREWDTDVLLASRA